LNRASDNFSGGLNAPVVSSALDDIDVLVLWLDKFSEESVITLMDETGVFAFSLAEIIKKQEVTGQIGKLR
jgi:hypothetical protein